MVLLRLALDLRPDFTAARLLAADILDSDAPPGHRAADAGAGAADDPLIAVVRLRRAALTEQTGRTEEALHQLEQIARDYPDRPEPYGAAGRHPARQAPLRRRGRRLRQGGGPRRPTRRPDWPLFYDRGIALERSKDWPPRRGRFHDRARSRPGPAVTC